MRKIITITAIGLTTLGVVACGGSESKDSAQIQSNDEKVSAVQEQEQSTAEAKQEILSKLKPLRLHEYAGVEDSYTVPIGSPDVHLGDEGQGIEQCSINDVVAVSAEELSLYASDDSALVSPDENIVVDVDKFSGSSQAKCMAVVQSALGW